MEEANNNQISFKPITLFQGLKFLRATGGGERVFKRGFHYIFSIIVPKCPKIKNIYTTFLTLFADLTTHGDP